MFLTVLLVGLGHWTPPQMLVTALLVGLGWECLKVICIFSAHSTVFFSLVLQTLACSCSIYNATIWSGTPFTRPLPLHTCSSIINVKYFYSCHVIDINVMPSFVKKFSSNYSAHIKKMLVKSLKKKVQMKKHHLISEASTKPSVLTIVFARV